MNRWPRTFWIYRVTCANCGIYRTARWTQRSCFIRCDACGGRCNIFEIRGSLVAHNKSEAMELIQPLKAEAV